MVASEGVEIFGGEGVAKAVSCPILSPEKGFRLYGVLQNSPLIDIPTKLCNAYKGPIIKLPHYMVDTLVVTMWSGKLSIDYCNQPLFFDPAQSNSYVWPNISDLV